MQAAQTPASKLRFVTFDKESSMTTLWQEEEFEQICSRESLMERASEIEKTISVKEHERERHDFKIFYENRFWNERPDGIVINKNHQTLCILEIKRSSDSNADFLEVKEAEANEQHKSIIEASKRLLPQNGPLNRLILEIIIDLPFGFPINNIISLILWQGGVVQ